MKARQGFVLVTLAAMSALAQAQQSLSKETIIKQAVHDGAIVVMCDCGICRNTATREVVGSGEGGPYLVYPDGPDAQAKEQQVAALLAKAQ